MTDPDSHPCSRAAAALALLVILALVTTILTWIFGADVLIFAAIVLLFFVAVAVAGTVFLLVMHLLTGD